jgi:hypothetical protein
MPALREALRFGYGLSEALPAEEAKIILKSPSLHVPGRAAGPLVLRLIVQSPPPGAVGGAESALPRQAREPAEGGRDA